MKECSLESYYSEFTMVYQVEISFYSLYQLSSMQMRGLHKTMPHPGEGSGMEDLFFSLILVRAWDKKRLWNCLEVTLFLREGTPPATGIAGRVTVPSTASTAVVFCDYSSVRPLLGATNNTWGLAAIISTGDICLRLRLSRVRKPRVARIT